MTLFDDIPRTELRPKFDSESEFKYHNLSARPGVAAYRDIAEKWFQQYPNEHKRDLWARYRSPSLSDHHAAFFELYLHQLLLSTGCVVEIHPSIPETGNHPDFLACDQSGTQCYIEAVLAHGPSKESEAAGRRTARVYDCLNQMHSPNFFVGVHITGSPRTSPPGARLRRDLEEWLVSLDPDDILKLYQEQRRDEVPRFPWNHDGWALEFEPIPKSPSSRGKPGVRPLGTRVPECRWTNTAGELRNAVRSKAKKYGRLDLPLIVCVNVLDWTDRVDVFNALIGDEQVVVTFANDDTILREEPGRKKNGVFGWEGEPRTRRVSAVAVARDLVPWTMGKINPELFHHPWPYLELPQNFWPMQQWIPNRQERRLQAVEGRAAASLLGLPDPWPVSLE